MHFPLFSFRRKTGAQEEISSTLQQCMLVLEEGADSTGVGFLRRSSYPS